MPNDNVIDVFVGRAVRRHREKKGWDHLKLATAADLTEQELVTIEAGTTRLNAMQAFLIVRALGIRVSDLYRDQGCRPPVSACDPSR